MDKKQIVAFQKRVWGYYLREGRHDLPWRFGVGEKVGEKGGAQRRPNLKRLDPYSIFVSELMLQQTQVDRVIPKYFAFIKKFPDVFAVARAKQSDIVRLWQGLGYNRRALYLKKACESVAKEHNGKFPVSFDLLIKLPGIGPYTAGAICAFAYNQPVVFIETNIRSVFLHEFFAEQSAISDKEIFPLIEQTIDSQNPREWYWALMDYGSFLKKSQPNPSQRSMHHKVQSRFIGSDRQIRGAIVFVLGAHSILSKNKFFGLLAKYEKNRVSVQLERLLCEGFVTQKGEMFRLTD